jgi:hypothetical protein
LFFSLGHHKLGLYSEVPASVLYLCLQCIRWLTCIHKAETPKQFSSAQFPALFSQPISMANQEVSKEYAEVSKIAKYPFEPYWSEKQLRVCVTGAGGFIASHLAKRLKSEGHYVIACDWKRNEHFSVSLWPLCRVAHRTWP